MSTVLETIQDKDKETKARHFLETTWECQAINMPQFSPVDCLLVKPDKTCGVEFKFRKMDYGQYPNVWMEVSKQIALRSCLDVWDRAYFMPCLNGTLYMIDILNTIGGLVVEGGRIDRSYNDMDYMVEVPMELLTKVGKIW